MDAEESGYSIDILVAHNGECRKGVAGKLAIEVDGPSHYLLPAGREANGNTRLKRCVLLQLGYQVASVPYWEWNGLEGDDAKDVYLRRLLEMT